MLAQSIRERGFDPAGQQCIDTPFQRVLVLFRIKLVLNQTQRHEGVQRRLGSGPQRELPHAVFRQDCFDGHFEL